MIDRPNLWRKPNSNSAKVSAKMNLFNRWPDVLNYMKLCCTNFILHKINIQWRQTRWCHCSTCTTTFTPSPKVYSIKWGENSPKFPVPILSAPALFRALWRQWTSHCISICVCSTSDSTKKKYGRPYQMCYFLQ